MRAQGKEDHRRLPGRTLVGRGGTGGGGEATAHTAGLQGQGHNVADDPRRSCVTEGPECPAEESGVNPAGKGKPGQSARTSQRQGWSCVLDKWL